MRREGPAGAAAAPAPSRCAEPDCHSAPAPGATEPPVPESSPSQLPSLWTLQAGLGFPRNPWSEGVKVWGHLNRTAQVAGNSASFGDLG